MSKNKLPNLKNLFSAWLPVITWAGLMFYLSDQSSLPSFKISVVNFLFVKTAHIFVYAVLFFLINRALKINTKLNINFAWKLALVLTLTYAISDEVHQSFIPNRFGTLRDVGYDMLGASLVILRDLRYI